MRGRLPVVLGWLCCALAGVLVGFLAVLTLANDPAGLAGNVAFGLILASLATVGALITSRRRQNPIGWVLCVAALAAIFAGCAEQYAQYALYTRPGSLPAGSWLAWLYSWVGNFAFALLFTCVILLFPTGRLLSGRWRLFAAFAVLVITLDTVGNALVPTILHSRFPGLISPVDAGSNLEVFRALRGVGEALIPVVLLGCLFSLGLRFRHSRGDERQQIKWFAYAVTMALLFLITSAVLSGVVRLDAAGQVVANLLWFLAVATLPLTIGIAIFKYRLYDIDLIIRRTLTYAVLTVLLAAIYFGGVVALQALLRPLTGAGNDLAVVGTTLLIAALALPLRRRVQTLIDQRFYRRKYDVAQTLAGFSAHLRDEVDLDHLTGRLLEVVDETMRPAHVSLWLFGAGATPDRAAAATGGGPGMKGPAP